MNGISQQIEAGRITKKQARILEVFLRVQDIEQTAEELGMSINDTSEQFRFIYQRRVIRRTWGKGQYGLQKIACEEKMTEKHEWMLDNYHNYRRNRSEAARILGCSRADICYMAIALQIDML